MAFWDRRRNQQVTVYYWDRALKKQRVVPREVTAHLDDLADAEVEQWVAGWESSDGRARVRSKARALAASDQVAVLIQGFMEEHEALRDTGHRTRQDLRHCLEHYAVEYFVRQHATKNVRRWWLHTATFPVWLRATYNTLHIDTVKKIIHAVRRFGEYLATHHIIPQPWLIPLPRVRKRPTTPLLRAVAPEAALAAAAKLEPRWALVVLLGYFASLRPEETYALTKADFVTGTRAKRDAKTHARFAKQGLGSGLSVVVAKTKTRDGDTPLAKTHYAYGVVNVWSVEAAMAVAAAIRDLPDGPLFVERRWPLDRQYDGLIKPLLEASAYDLRRASGLYLGREIGLEPFLLQDHFRHSVLTTTLLYTRRPLDEQETAETQDFDDVT
jgi:hypothetical protein